MNNLNKVSLEVSSSLLYYYGKERRGSSYLVGALIDKVESYSNEAENLESDLLA